VRLEIDDDSLVAAVQRIVHKELAAFFGRVAELSGELQTVAAASMPATEPTTAASTPQTEPTPTALKGVSPNDMLRFAEYVLEEADGGPLHVRVIARRMFRLGFQHRRQPKNPEQILSSLNSLASPSQHPERFKRSGPRMLELVR